jgi:hypothetical protein
MYTGGWSEGRVYNGIVRKDERLDHTVSTFTRNWWHLRLSQLSAIVCVTFNAGVIVTESAIALAQLCTYLRCGMANAFGGKRVLLHPLFVRCLDCRCHTQAQDLPVRSHLLASRSLLEGSPRNRQENIGMASAVSSSNVQRWEEYM